MKKPRESTEGPFGRPHLVYSENNKETPDEIKQLRAIAKAMDSLFTVPGFERWRFGLDALIGLIPGVGDLIGFGVSTYFILIAARLNVSKIVLARMILNVMIDTGIGSIPFAGDLFDFAWKANRKNLELIDLSVIDPKKAKKRSALFLAGIALMVFLAAAGVLALAFLLFRYIIQIGSSAWSSLQ